jgi:gamma-glutamyltranspeptidase / glutathione hydrolase
MITCSSGRKAIAAAACAFSAFTGTAAAQVGQPTAIGTRGAAATVDAHGTQAAIATLRAGGNAVDAAVSAAAVLGVTEPFSCGVGGGGFMVIRTAKGKITTIDHRELSPAAMRPDSFQEGGTPLGFDAARYSGLSAGVPGTVAGWERALERYGTWTLRRALRPGIRVAERGFLVDRTFAQQTEPNVPWFDDVPSTAALYLDADGTARDVGSRLRNPDLARTYRRIAARGASAFYSGPIAEAMVAAAQRPPIAAQADHVWRAGLMTADDVRRYTAPERAPVRSEYRDLDIWGMGPPSSGGAAVAEALNILEGYRDLGVDRTQALHLFLEASRSAFADRNAYLADDAFFDVPLRGLLSGRYAAERRSVIPPNRARTSPVPPGDPYPYQPGPAAPPPSFAATVDRGRSTTHLVVADRKGTVVSYTFTIESTGGNGIVVPGWGFLLNNELTDFNYDSTTHPNRADARKRPRSSMSPTIVTENGRPALALGSPGGSTIITTVLQILLERIDLGRPLPAAIAAPRATQRNTASTLAEATFAQSPEGRALAESYGHRLGASPEIGAATAIEFLRRGRFLAAAEPVRRGGGSAMVAKSR